MAGVAAVLLDQVEDEPPQAGRLPVGKGGVRELVKTAVPKAAASFTRDRSAASSQKA